MTFSSSTYLPKNFTNSLFLVAEKYGILKKQFTYQMMPKKKEGDVSGPGKIQCLSVGKYQDKEAGRGYLRIRGTERGLWDFCWGAILERGNHLECK